MTENISNISIEAKKLLKHKMLREQQMHIFGNENSEKEVNKSLA